MATDAPALPRELQLEVTAACNLACTMCLVSYRPKIGKRQGSMSYEMFRQLVDELPGLERLTLQGLGEPLLAPGILDMISYASERGIAVGFNTNAQLLTPERSEQLVGTGLSWLCISVDGAVAETYESIRGGAQFSRLERHVPALTAAVRRRGGGPDLSLVFVAMRRNIAELPDVVRLAARWGVPKVRVQNLSHSFDDTDPSGSYADIRRFAAEQALWTGQDHARAEEAFEQARAAADEVGCELRLPRLDEPGNGAEEGEPVQRGCDWPWRSAYVTHSGSVQPCCMVMGSDRVSLGDVNDTPFGRIWEGEAYGEFRTLLEGDDPPDVCRGCSLYRRVF
ncbi:MAG TPA: radical SAM protein [Gaiellales bacterium]|jgi:radical SAM protein with 4Fe4S-binding SPASM domain|nr:radical SAM protein [Gaiellales bacterium]